MSNPTTPEKVTTINLIANLAYTVELLCKALDNPDRYPPDEDGRTYIDELRGNASQIGKAAREARDLGLPG